MCHWISARPRGTPIPVLRCSGLLPWVDCAPWVALPGLTFRPLLCIKRQCKLLPTLCLPIVTCNKILVSPCTCTYITELVIGVIKSLGSSCELHEVPHAAMLMCCVKSHLVHEVPRPCVVASSLDPTSSTRYLAAVLMRCPDPTSFTRYLAAVSTSEVHRTCVDEMPGPYLVSRGTSRLVDDVYGNVAVVSVLLANNKYILK